LHLFVSMFVIELTYTNEPLLFIQNTQKYMFHLTSKSYLNVGQ